MLDEQIKSQLQSVYAQLENEVNLVYDESNHEDQNQLLELIRGVAETSDKIQVLNSGRASSAPHFHVQYKNQPNGISFTGIPTGHEFTSLILAILNSDGKGKMPDQLMKARIQSLKGPIKIRTFISLTCENCPDVVQALNQMAIIHPEFSHEMVDGAYAQDEITKLGIQGVPSIVVNDQMIHSGRIQFLDLLALLEKTFGVDQNSNQTPVEKELGHYDVAVIGGGPAGVSAAIYSVRKGLKTILIADKIGGQVQETKGIENLISVVYTEGPQLSAQLLQHLTSYPVQLFENRRVKSLHKNLQTQIELETGETLTAESTIVTTGARWRELGVPGEKEFMGRGVAYCPHCDGPFYKGKKVAVVGGGNSGVEAAIDLAGIVREVVLFEYNDQLKADQILVDKLKSMPNVTIKTNAKTTQIVGDQQKVQALQYQDRPTDQILSEELDGVFIQIGLVPNSQFLKGTVELSKYGEVMVDEKGRTSVPGIYAAGDVTTTPYKQIVIAMGEGAKVALAAFEDRIRS